jgi:hypothetical protein
VDAQLLNRLLAQGESSHLDYKSGQYRFVGATDGEKSELLKDVLAMANAWRDSDGYILIGVRERPGQKAELVGVTDHLDDADLQQFVNSKTKQPVRFSYTSFEADGRSIAVIHVPIQQRPSFILKRFGAVGPNTVYLRRGSSTDIADPEEVHAMGMASSSGIAPTVIVEFADLKKRKTLGQQLRLARNAILPLTKDKLPPKPQAPYSRLMGINTTRYNSDYWPELQEYMCLRSLVGRVGFAITNASAVVANGVRLKLQTPLAEAVVILDELPSKPRSSYDILAPTHVPIIHPRVESDVDFSKHGDEWHIEVVFGKVQPGATEWTRNVLLIGTADARTVSLGGHVFGDDFGPVPIELRIASEPSVQEMTLDMLSAESDRKGRREDD